MKKFTLSLLTHPRMLFWLMPFVMLLLVIGTLAQRELGLYAAEQRFFASWIAWLGPVPMPGMYPLLTLLSVSLLTKLALKSPWSARQSGNIVTHLGALLLMIGGLLTAIGSEEGYLSVAEGETSQIVYDYHDRELALLDEAGHTLGRIHFDALVAGESIDMTLATQPLKKPIIRITIERAYRNALPTWNDAPDAADEGIAQQVLLQPQPLEKQDEANLAGAIVRVAGKRYVLFEPMQNRPEVTINGQNYTLAVRKVQRELPFSVTLLDFEKMTYPGTDTAREYQSQVVIDEGDGLRWQALIRMNEPLRVQGHTLYQSSFLQRDGEIVSVLAVVKNKGRVFPYVASIMLGLGILLHLWMRRRRA